ncbi:MAG: glycerol-3-phosphate 1-O-acyltransferase PlsY [Lachnospiraceae bacterium]|nr:glycerol-3-phosphate 1-O-acyltransferase PlsY [Lachnospiraceae bacterium]
MIPYAILVLGVGYLFGCFQTGYFIGRLNKIDIRDYGSGNAGTTNVLRTLGLAWALPTFLGDALKGLVWVLIVKYFVAPMVPSIDVSILILFAGLGAVLGHNYPFQLGFKGGKGIATTVAIMMGFDWRMALIGAALFILVCACTRYVSLSSIVLAVSMPIQCLFFYPGRWDIFVLVLLYALSAVYRHKANIGRLLNGTESKLGQKVDPKSGK